MLKLNFKENLKQLRIEKGLSQDELAKLLNTSLKTISHWETGYSEPSLTQLCELAKIFDISTEELLDYKNSTK